MRYTCDSQCARVLFVVGMAREGVTNPLCAITASTSDEATIVEAVQRWFGRGLGSVIHTDSNGEVHCAPDRLDTVHFVYHEANSKTGETAKVGIRWILDMERQLGELPTIGDLMDDKTMLVEPDPQTIDDPLTASDKVAMAVKAVNIGGDDWRIDDETVDQIVKNLIGQYAPANPKKAERVRQYVSEQLRESPRDAFKIAGHLLSKEELPCIPVVLSEQKSMIQT